MYAPLPQLKSDALAIAVRRELGFEFASPVVCVGGKAKQVRYLTKLMPAKIDYFFEPFGGGLSTTIFLINTGRVKTFNCHAGDLHSPLVNFHRVLQADYESLTLILLEDCFRHGNGSRELFNEAVDDINGSDDSFKQARGYYIHNRIGMLGIRKYAYGSFASSLAQPGQGLTRSKILRLPHYGALMQGITIEERSYTEALDDAAAKGGDTLVFLDPPYEGHDESMYDVKFDFDDFATRCHAAKGSCKLMITINDSPANRSRFDGYSIMVRDVRYGMSDSIKSELVICGYELDCQDYYLNQLGYRLAA